MAKFGSRKTPKVPYGKEPSAPIINTSRAKYQPPRIAKSEFYKIIIGQIFKWVSYLILLVLATYMIFAVTIVRFIPTLDESVGYLVPVKNMTFSGGKATPGSEIVVSLGTPQGSSTFDKLKQAVTISDDLVVVEVLAGPNGRITWAETGLVAIDGDPLGTPLMEKPENEFLLNQYVVKCVAGKCEKNSGMIVDAGNIFGEPLKDFNVEG